MRRALDVESKKPDSSGRIHGSGWLFLAIGSQETLGYNLGVKPWKDNLTLISLMLLIAVSMIVLPFFIGTWEKRVFTHSRIYGLREDRAGGLEAYLMHSLDDSFGGFRDPVFPVAVVAIDREETWYAPPRKGGVSRTGIVRLHTSELFTIRIRNGEGGHADGGTWDYPALDQRTSQEIEPGSIAYEAMKDQPREMQELMRDILDGIPNPGGEIEQERRMAMILAVQRALRADGFGWVADGVDVGSWSRSGMDLVGVARLLVGAVLVLGLVYLLGRLFPSKK